jgi:N6-adenosine-specific RNA methylase IME4
LKVGTGTEGTKKNRRTNPMPKEDKQGKYQIIYADPPWAYPKTGGTKNSRGMAKQFYPTMSLEPIKNLPVEDIAADDSVLFLWATYPQLPNALEVIRAWGFTYFGLGFEWIKRNPNTGKDSFGMGYWTRANPECCLLATRGKPKPNSHSVRQLTYAPLQEHSKKPAIIRDKIVELCGNLPRIELFARQKVEGWDSWGNEVESDIELASLKDEKEDNI